MYTLGSCLIIHYDCVAMLNTYVRVG